MSRAINSFLRVILVVAAVSGGPTATAQTEDLYKLNARLFELYRTGKYSDAIVVGERLLKEAEASLAPTDPKMLAFMNNLAALYRAQGRYAEAEPLYRTVLEKSRAVLGDDHPDTLRVELSLAVLLVNIDRSDEAVKRLSCIGEPPREYRRLISLSQAALANSCSC